MSTLQVDKALQGAVSHIAPCAADLLKQRVATPAGRAAATRVVVEAADFQERLHSHVCAFFSAFIIAVHAVSKESEGRRWHAHDMQWPFGTQHLHIDCCRRDP